jgi:putative ABC transport system permease protein
MVSVTTALRALAANKLRSALTMLGVMIGVGAVIFAVSVGDGSRAAVIENIRRMGTNVLTIFPGQQRSGGVAFGAGSVNTMKLEDAPAILRACPSVEYVSPQVQRNQQIKYQDKNTNTQVQGTGEDYPIISNSPVAEGRYFTAQEVKAYKRVAVLGDNTWHDLFDQVSPVGKTIRVGGQSFQVIGLLKEKGGMGWRNPDDAVYVPVTTAMRRLFGLENVQNITCMARSDSLMDKAQDEIDAVMRKRHKIATGGEADFRIFNQADIMQMQTETQDNISTIVFWMGILALLVGGIGIMNIMLVSVTERTREIGIRKAIGAKRRNIISQFLLEALLLSLVGGLIGVIGGIAFSNFFGNLKNWQILIAPETVLTAYFFSAFTGVFFGLYPAYKASRLNPIEALRYE